MAEEVGFEPTRRLITALLVFRTNLFSLLSIPPNLEAVVGLKPTFRELQSLALVNLAIPPYKVRLTRQVLGKGKPSFSTFVGRYIKLYEQKRNNSNLWGEGRGTIPQHLDPQSSALPIELPTPY